MDKQRTQLKMSKVIKKLYLSAFVVISFVLYALQKPQSNTNASSDPTSSLPDPRVSELTLTATATDEVVNQPTPTTPPSDPATSTAVPQQVIAPTATPVPPPTIAKGQYKDGTYDGPEVNAFYGLVRVQTVIRNGKIANVQFLEYPQDRRTSQRINTFAVPMLQQEALQAQTANVDIVTGATLTSEAFATSLQSALDQAKN